MKNLQITENSTSMLIALVLISLVSLMLVSTGADQTIIIVLCNHNFPRSEPKNEHQRRKIAQIYLPCLLLFPSLQAMTYPHVVV